MSQYESRLSKIQQIRAKLRRKRVSILRKEKELEALGQEQKEVTDMIKESQVQYFQKAKIGRSRYLEETESHQERLAEIEDEKTTMELKLAKETGKAKHKLLMLIERFLEWTENRTKHKTIKKFNKKTKKNRRYK